MPSPVVLIYRDRLLPISQTFVRQHYDSLTRYEPVFAGLRAVDSGMDLSGRRRILLEDDGRSSAKIAAFKLLGRAPAFLRAIEAVRPEIIHAHFAIDAVDMLPVAKRLGVPLVVTLHGYDATYSDAALRRMGPVGWNFLIKRKRLQQEAALFLPVSDYLRDQAIAQGYPADKVRTHYLGIDLTAFTGRAAEEPRKAIVFVGRLVEKKGLNYLIEAVAALPEPYRSTELRILGDGPLRAEYEALAEWTGVRATFLGAQPHSRVVEELARAKVFSMPSVPARTGDNEGFGLTLIEAQAMGVPAVSFAQGPIPEAVEDGVTGLLAPSRDVKALSQHLATLLGDDQIRRQMGDAAARRVRTLFDLKVRTSLLEESYDSLLAGSLD